MSHPSEPYSSLETRVEIRHASHLDKTWRRFVQRKQLYHALEEDDGCHSVSTGGMDYLVNVFSLHSKKENMGKQTPPITAEFLAEAGAIELLCPMTVRREIAALDLEDFDEHCAKYGIPGAYGWFAFGAKWTDAIQGFMKQR